MISIIIASKSACFFNALATNIEETIGVEYEVIKIENGEGKLSICAAYNLAAAQAKFPYLIFVHEDVLFQTNGWGQNLINHFNADKEIGLIGIAGSVYKSKMSTAWWQSEPGWDEIRRMNMVQHYKDANRASKVMSVNPDHEVRSSVVAMDGVFLATTKEVWQQNKFDDKLLKGFHGYDLDFCLQVYQTKKVVVVYDILLSHFSGGTSDGKWLTEITNVHVKWKKHLPAFTVGCEPNKSVYLNGLKRLRKQMNLLIEEDHNIYFLIKNYHRSFSFLDNRPPFPIVLKDYVRELVRIVKLKLAGSQVAVKDLGLK